MSEHVAEPEMTAQERLVHIIESRTFQLSITALIVLNAVTLGLETYDGVRARFGTILDLFDRLVIVIFVAEILLKLFAYRLNFFKDGWRIFDFVVVLISIFPDAGPFTVLRALRVMRVFHIMSVMPQLRRVVEALFRALPGMGGIIAVLALIFFVSSVMATQLFRGAGDNGKFDSLGNSAITLFQVMTLEGWSEDVMRPVLDDVPFAWVFFLVFITLTSFAVLNLFIAVIVDALQNEAFAEEEERDKEEKALMEAQHAEVLATLAVLREEIEQLRQDRGANRN